MPTGVAAYDLGKRCAPPCTPASAKIPTSGLPTTADAVVERERTLPETASRVRSRSGRFLHDSAVILRKKRGDAACVRNRCWGFLHDDSAVILRKKRGDAACVRSRCWGFLHDDSAVSLRKKRADAATHTSSPSSIQNAACQEVAKSDRGASPAMLASAACSPAQELVSARWTQCTAAQELLTAHSTLTAQELFTVPWTLSTACYAGQEPIVAAQDETTSRK